MARPPGVGTKASGNAKQLRQRSDRGARVGAGHGGDALWARGGVVHIAFELEAEAVIARDAQERKPEVTASKLDLHGDIAVGAAAVVTARD